MADTVLAIDQGTTSSRAILFDAQLRPIASGQREFRQIFPASGHVEHDAEEIWQSVLVTCREAIAKGGMPSAIGITNQRETVVIWDRESGQPIHNALVWQDRRTAARSARFNRTHPHNTRRIRHVVGCSGGAAECAHKSI